MVFLYSNYRVAEWQTYISNFQFELTYGPICSTAFPSESHKNEKIIGISIDEKDPNIQ